MKNEIIFLTKNTQPFCLENDGFLRLIHQTEPVCLYTKDKPIASYHSLNDGHFQSYILVYFRDLRLVPSKTLLLLAPPDGLEPPNAESESAVLPLD